MIKLNDRHSFLREKIEIMIRLIDPKRFEEWPQHEQRWKLRLFGNQKLAEVIGIKDDKDEFLPDKATRMARILHGRSGGNITSMQLMLLAKHFKLDLCKSDAYLWLRDTVNPEEFQRLLLDYGWSDPTLGSAPRLSTPRDVLKALDDRFALVRGSLKVGAFDALKLARKSPPTPLLEITRGMTSRHQEYLDLTCLAPLTRAGVELDGAEGRWALVLNLDWCENGEGRHVLVSLAPGAQAPYRQLRQRDLLPDRPAPNLPGSHGWLLTPTLGRQDVLVILTAKRIELPWPEEDGEHAVTPGELDRLIARLEADKELGVELHHAPFLVLN